MKLRPAGLSPELGLWVGISICSLSPLNAGVYLGTTTCKPQDIPQGANFCQQGTTVPSPGDGVTPFGVTHPPGYAGAGGSLVVNVCVSPEDSDLIPPTQRAVATWQSLTREVGQCLGCYLHEEGDPNPSSVPYHAESVVLHELGHCAVGLDHSDLQFDPPGDPERFERTSFTMSYDGVPEGIDAGIDEIRGSCDDVQESILGEIPESVHWFRRADNDPAIIDSTIIDTNSYSRSITQGLPQQCSWAANGNRAVNGQLGFSYTQNVMYSAIARGQKYLGLSSDDVNMVEMGMTGQDWLASTPSDNYTIDLRYVTDCSQADIQVDFFPLGLQAEIGACNARVALSFPVSNPALARHYTVVRDGAGPLVVTLNSSLNWDFGTVEVVFVDGFETGDTSEWSATQP